MAKKVDGDGEKNDRLDQHSLDLTKSTFRLSDEESIVDSQAVESKVVTSTELTLKTIGDHEVISVLGRGGMGVVYKARHKTLGRVVAIKMILAGVHASPELAARFQVEARAAASLQNPNIVQVYEVGEENGLPYLAMEYIDGTELSSLVRDRSMDSNRAAEIVASLANAMQYAHDNGILHRDLKPGNVVLTNNGVPKITDFGLAKEIHDDSGQTRSGVIIGTPSYMSPEQANSETDLIGPSSDQYSLGAILYHLLTGRPPFLADREVETLLQIVDQDPVSPRRLQPAIPVDLETIVMKTLDKSQSGRYASCEDFAKDLERFLSNEPIAARPASVLEKSWRWSLRNPKIATLSALTALMLLVTSIVSTTAFFSISAANKKLEKQTSLALEQTELAKQQTEISKKQSLLATKNKTLAETKASSAKTQAKLAMKLVQEISTKVDSKLAENPGLSELRHEVLDQMLELMNKLDESVAANEFGQSTSTKMHLLDKKGKLFLASSQFKQAADIYDDLEGVARQQVEIQKASDASRSNLVKILTLQSKLKVHINRDLEEQKKYLNECLDLIDDIFSNPDPRDGFVMPVAATRFQYSDRLTEIAVIFMKTGDLQQTRDYFERAKVCREELLEDLEELADYASKSVEDRLKMKTAIKTNLDKSYMGLGVVEERLGNFEQAEVSLNAIYQSRKLAFANSPDNLEVKLVLAQTAGMLGKFYHWSDQHEKAPAKFEEALKIYRELNEFDREKAVYQRGLSLTLYQFASLVGDGTHYDELLEECLKIKAKMAGNDSADYDFHMMGCLARTGRVERALKIVEAATKHESPDAEIKLRMASCLAQCSCHAEEDSERDELLKQAVAEVAAAIELGYKNVYGLTRDPDLKPLQELESFQNVVSSIK